MTDLTALETLLTKLENAERPSREIDSEIMATIFPEWAKVGSPYLIYWHAPTPYYKQPIPKITSDLSSAVALVNHVLSGWAWKVGTCTVSDDAWLVPDHNCPKHRERLLVEFPPTVGSVFDNGVDIDRRPSGNVALALCEALITALIEIEKHKVRQSLISRRSL